MDLKEIIERSVNNLIESGAIEKAIATNIEKSVADAIKDSMSSYSTFGKQLTKAVQEALKVHGDIDLPSYNDAILKIVARQVETMTDAAIQRQVAERLKQLLTPAPESIKLSKLVEDFIERVKSEKESGCVCYGEEGKVSVHVTEPDKGFTYVYLDKEGNVPANKCEIKFGVYRGEVFSLSFQNQDVEKQMFVGPFYNFERLLFQMKAAKTKIELDVNEHDVSTSYELSHS